MTVPHSTDDAVAFLEMWRPGGPWVLTAIEVDPPKGAAPKVPTRTLTTPAEVVEWVNSHSGGKWNCYFTYNVTRGPISKKPTKDDMALAVALCCDVDPRAGEPLDAERGRISRQFDDWEVDGKKLAFPRPSVTIDSGGGMQGFFILREPVALDGADGAATARVEVRGKGIVEAFKGETDKKGADSVQNVDRIMRLPGTVNWPNEKKRKAGRVPRLARVVEADMGRTYGLEDFPAGVAKAAGAGAPAPGGRVAVTAAPAMDLDLSDLPPGVSDRIRAMIVQGEDLNDPGRYPSRSEAYWAVICAMARAGCSDEQMMGVSLTEHYKISGHVLNQPNPDDYARKQIAKARVEAAGDPQLTDMNARHAFLSHEGNKVRVCEFAYELEDPNEMDPERQRRRWVTYLQSAADFKATYNNRSAVVGKDKDGNEVKKPLGDTWMFWEGRRQHRALTFNPSAGELVGDKMNLWRGFPVRPKAGDWGLFKAHIKDVMAAGDPEVASYITRWLALAVQRPGEPAGVALVFKGGRGSGKGLFAHIARDLFGQHSYYLPGAVALTGKFNAHFRDTVLLYADEVKWNGNKNAESLLQAMITERELLVEGKYKDAALTKNCLHIIMTSNDDWVVPAGIDERRFAVFRTDDSKRGNKAYFKAIAAQMRGEGLAAMLHDLMAMDLSDFDPLTNMPASPELSQQKLEGLSGPNRVVWEMLMRGFAPGGVHPTTTTGKQVFHRPDPVVTLEAVIAWGLGQELIKDAPSTLRMGDAMKRMGIKRDRFSFEKRQFYAWGLPPIADARRAWAESLGLVGIDWPEVDGWFSMDSGG